MRTVTFIFCCLIVMSSCKRNPYEVDITGIDLDISIKRFERDLFSVDFDSIPQSIPWFYKKYGSFFDMYNYKIINIGGANQITYPQYLRTFLTDYLNNEVYNITLEEYPDLSDLEEQLKNAFRHYKFHFQDNPVPEVITFISRFNQSVVTAEGILGIGLDKYLGRDCEYYQRLGLHQYMILNMHRGKIVSDCMAGWGMTEFEYNDSVDNVLSNMIYHGKIMYFVKCMLPDQPDSLITGFTQKQLEFCQANERKMWEYLVEHKILFLSDKMSIQKFTGFGPFTTDFSRNSPARAAVWIGWMIVEDFARRNKELTLKDIMNENNYQKILTLSRYNP